MRVAVIGVGHVGKHHARVYAELPNVELVGVVDIVESRADETSRLCKTASFTDYRELFGKIDAASVAVPTIDHAWLGADLLEHGIDVLVEKPIASSAEQARTLIDAATLNKRVLQVGHVERFNPVVAAARELATKPQFFEIHRLAAFSPRSLDIDVVMDLMIHDIDIVLSLVGSPVSEVRAAGVPVITPRIDIANARIEFENGCIANLTASRVSGERVRKIRFFQPNQYISIDYSAQEAATV